MSLAIERQEIEEHFKTEWTDATPVGYDGEQFDRVNNSIRITINSGQAYQASFGSPSNNISRHVGIITLEVITEGGKGSATARGYADTIMDIFRNKNLGSVKTRIPYISARRDEAPFYIINVVVPFVRDDFNA